MKIILPVLCLLVVLGVVFGMAKVGLLPAQKWADKNPKLAPILRSLHLAKAAKKKPVLTASAATPKDPAAQALSNGQKQLAADRARFAQEQADWQAHKSAPPVAAPVPPPAGQVALPPIGQVVVPAKLSAIYAAMSPDDLARVLSKLPDPAVVQTLLALDPKKAGKILAALPDARAAHLTTLMMRSAAPAQTASNAPAPLPATSL